MSAITWLENHLLLTIHTSLNESPPSSVYHIITRQPPSTFTFNKLTDPVDPFGSDDVPHHFILRLKDFPPNLQDLLIVSSTASPDVGLLSRSSSPLATDAPADAITNTFTTTEMADDSRRATLPMTEDFQNTIPVGCALDLSAKETVYKPIPTEDIEESPGPVPGYWLLTHEGVLCSWWIIYTPSIKNGTTYSGMATADTSAQAPAQAATPAPAFAKPAPAAGSAFGSPSAAPAFGGASALGTKQSPWGTPSTPAAAPSTGGATFGSSSFGSAAASSSPAFGKPSAFGMSSNLGVKSSPWATGATSTTAPAFGQSGFASMGSGAGKSAFGSPSATQDTSSSSSGFAGFANKGGFGSLGSGSGTTGGSSIFGGSKPAGSPFGQATDTKTAFPPPQNGTAAAGTGVFGSSEPFKLQSSFKPDPAAKEETKEQPAKESGGLFGNGFGKTIGSALGETTETPPTPPSKEEDMDAPEPAPTPQGKSIFSMPSTTPTTTPAPSRFSFAPSTSKGSIFGGPSTPKPATGGLFGSAKPSQPEKEEEVPETPKVRANDDQTAETPLPPDSVSKMTYPSGDSSSSTGTLEAGRQSPVKVEDAPLPPDFTATPKAAPRAKPADDAPLPPDFLATPATPKSAIKDAGSSPRSPASTPPKTSEKQKSSIFGSPDDAPLPPDFISKPSKTTTSVPAVPESDNESGFSEEEDSDGSAVDVAKDLSPSSSGQARTPGMTPQSSFGGLGGSGFVVNKPNETSKSLFGEIGRNRGPIFPPPATTQRSPSPVRAGRPVGLDSIRSVSAPGMASQLLGSKKPPAPSALGMSILGKGVTQEDEAAIQQRQARERREAEESQPLVDEEADEIQHILAEEVEGTLEIDQLIAHTDVAGPAQKSIPAQVEAVYRDINAMIDTLGLNARSVKAFVKGHSERPQASPRTKENLEIPDDWVLCELEDLSEVVDGDLASSLEASRVRDVEEKKDECHELSRNLSRLRAKQNDLDVMLAKFDPEHTEAMRNMPLSAEQSAQQTDLRREFARFSKVLSETEEAVTLLKTRLASAGGASGRGPQPPTVEAVMRTIAKMTNMVEKRSGDVDVLEDQMRKLNVGSASREGTPISPRTPRKSAALSESVASVGVTPRGFRSSLASSPFKGAATPPRKRVSGFSVEEKRELMDRRARKIEMLQKLRVKVEDKGVSVWTMDEE